eukprot:5845556-Pyramimonas_sp.AAC.1
MLCADALNASPFVSSPLQTPSPPLPNSHFATCSRKSSKVISVSTLIPLQCYSVNARIRLRAAFVSAGHKSHSTALDHKRRFREECRMMLASQMSDAVLDIIRQHLTQYGITSKAAGIVQ